MIYKYYFNEERQYSFKKLESLPKESTQNYEI